MTTDPNEVIAVYEGFIGKEPYKLIGAMAQSITSMVNAKQTASAVLLIEAHRKENENGMDRPHQPG